MKDCNRNLTRSDVGGFISPTARLSGLIRTKKIFSRLQRDMSVQVGVH